MHAVILNRQKAVGLDLSLVRTFVRSLRKPLGLGRRSFNVCFVTDREIARLNATYLGRRRPTDVLSFPWHEDEEPGARGSRPRELCNFLGDVVISAETARRNARSEGHAAQREICWLILHGVLHLLGYDHETDQGEMTSLELSLRERLGVAGGAERPRKAARRKSR